MIRYYRICGHMTIRQDLLATAQSRDGRITYRYYGCSICGKGYYYERKDDRFDIPKHIRRGDD